MRWTPSGRAGRAQVAALAVLAVSAAALTAVAASGTGSTYAAFSDFAEDPGHEVGAAHVEVALSPRRSELAYAGLVPGDPQSDTLKVTYAGSTAADLALRLQPLGGSAYCLQDASDSWVSREGVVVQLSVGSGWLDYCSLLDPLSLLVVAHDVQPGESIDVDVAVRVEVGTDERFSLREDTDVLAVVAQQPGSDAFSDWVTSTIFVATGVIHGSAPAVPQDDGASPVVAGETETDHGSDVPAGPPPGEVAPGAGHDVPAPSPPSPPQQSDPAPATDDLGLDEPSGTEPPGTEPDSGAYGELPEEGVVP